MGNQSYERQVQAMAAKFARQLHPAAFADRSRSVQDSNLWHLKVDNYKSIARMAVAEKADLAESFYHAEAMRDGWGPDQIDSIVQKKLKDNGLVPDDEPGDSAIEETKKST